MLPLLNGLNEQKPRQIAAQILHRRNTGNDFVEDLLASALAQSHLSAADRGLCQELVYGVVRWQATLDWLIARKTPGRTQKAGLQNLLRLGLYQIFWLDRIPNHAAVNETVEQARQNGFGPQAGFVNAVLRGYLREFDATKTLLADLKTAQPHLGYSHPEWLVIRWQKRWGSEKAAQLMEWNNTPPKTFARINTLKFQTTDDGRAHRSARTESQNQPTRETSPNAGTTSPSPPRSGGLEPLGKRRKEFAEGEGPRGSSEREASESLGRGEVAFGVEGQHNSPRHPTLDTPSSPGELLTEWRNENVEYEFIRRDWFEENLVFELKSHPPLAKLRTFQQGLFYIQDPSTLLAVRELDPEPGETILDLCAAPGGKLTYIAQLMRNQGRLIAHDTFPDRLKLIEENCARLGVTIAETALSSNLFPTEIRKDAFANLTRVSGKQLEQILPLPGGLEPLGEAAKGIWQSQRPERAERAGASESLGQGEGERSLTNLKFDRVLVDAPCSNTGVMRRRVDLRWRIRPEELDRLRATQLDLLHEAATRLKPGGTLIYSTCSLEPEENETVIREFLANSPWLKLETHRELLPFNEVTDGAFVARLRKAS
ncbi:MAG TPA: transcription antitermination factor NusB [Candidatus Angelobacter sp.]|nr:transcription antitermination factor NusB [Candidatus Angelobacter sp.]